MRCVFCRFSVESQKRNSFDSTVSVQAVEMTKTVRKVPRSKRRRRKRRAGKWGSRPGSRRNSNASQISSMEKEVLIRVNFVLETTYESYIPTNRFPANSVLVIQLISSIKIYFRKQSFRKTAENKSFWSYSKTPFKSKIQKKKKTNQHGCRGTFEHGWQVLIFSSGA